MKEEKIDIFSNQVLVRADAICITTNLQTKKNGDAVMGAGVAKAAAKKWPQLPAILGKKLKSKSKLDELILENIDDHLRSGRTDLFTSNIHELYTFQCTGHPVTILSLPTKNHWKDPSPIKLVMMSLLELNELTEDKDWQHVFLTRPGCGLGGLSWEKNVKPFAKTLLDDRFTICYL